MTYNWVDSGLRGGMMTYHATDSGYAFELDEFKWTDDVAVSGTVSWNQISNLVTAQVTLKSADSEVGALQIRWNDADINAVASVTGEIQGAIAERIAP